MVLEERVPLLSSQVLEKEELCKRWHHAMIHEIATVCMKEELRTYQFLKGPINDVLFFLPYMSNSIVILNLSPTFC